MIDDSGIPTLDSLKADVRQDVDNQADDLEMALANGAAESLIREIATHNVPTMNATLLLMAYHDLTLGFPDDVPDAESMVDRQGAYGIIACCIEECLRDEAERYWQEINGQDEE